jgi:hypothetical protein
MSLIGMKLWILSFKIALNTKNMSTVSDKIKTRLEQLDQYDDDNMQEMANLSQQEYIKRIDELNNALQAAWAEDDRVKSLKIVIQVIFQIQIIKVDEKHTQANFFSQVLKTISRYQCGSILPKQICTHH